MAKGYDSPPKTKFAAELRATAARHGKFGRGAQAWLVLKSGKDDGMVSVWWNGKKLPAEQAFEEFVAKMPTEDRGPLRTAWRLSRDEQEAARSEIRRSRALVPRPEPAATTLDVRPEEADGLIIVLGLMRQLDWKEALGAIKGKLTDLGAKLPGHERERPHAPNGPLRPTGTEGN